MLFRSLEKDNELESLKEEKRKEKNKRKQKEKKQMALFSPNDPIISKLEEKDVLDMTPMEAMNFVYELKKDLKERERKDA